MAPGFLRRSSTSGSKNRRDSVGDPKITPEERARLKQRTANIADPILTAMREEQPFEVTNNHHEGQTTVSPEHLRDMFGQPIDVPDRSNPTRHRDERPLDTVRGFEYAATGDKWIKEQIFRERLPWEGRRYQPASYSSNYADDAYDQTENYNPASSSVSSTPRATIQLGNSGEVYADPVQVNPPKKKKGLFGRKK